MLGVNPDVADLSPFQWTMYIIYSTIIVIVNLNLLITIIGETYAKVSETMEQTNCRMQADLLLEIGGFKYWKRKAGQETFLHLITDLNNIDDDDINTDMRIKSLVESQDDVLKMMKD